MTEGVVERRGKALRERILAAIMLVVSSPLALVCALAIKFEGFLNPNARGPIFLKEERVSRGKRFNLIKFRTLDSEAVRDLSPTRHIATHEIEDRWTKVGWHLHQWYLDELPQLWNILRGDMNLIGTRPWPVELYER